MKDLLKLAWRNIWRNWRRTILTSFAVAFAVISIIFAHSYIKGIFESYTENFIKTETGHVKIASREFLRMERVMPKEHLIYDSQNIEESLSVLPGISSMTERIKFYLILSHEEKNELCLGVGINPEQETNFLNLEQYLIQGNHFQTSSQEMIIGYRLAEKLGVSLGDELLAVTTDINYSTYALTFTVAGIFKTGSTYMDKNFFYISLKKAQELLDCAGAVHEIFLLVEEPETAPEIASIIQNLLKEKDLDETLISIPWQEHFMIKTIGPFASNFYASIMLIIMLIAGLVILNTMLMAVLERTHEIGIIKSMGMRDKGIVFLILIEALFIGILGTSIGGLLGSSLSIIVQNTGIDFSQVMENIEVPIATFISTTIYPKFTLSILIGSISFGLVTTLLAALYPAFKASRMTPVDALRTSLK